MAAGLFIRKTPMCVTVQTGGGVSAKNERQPSLFWSLSADGKVSSFTWPKVEGIPAGARRRCYGAAVEAALASVRYDPGARPSAPRLQELLSQLDADGHDTTAFRQELEQILDVMGLILPARSGKTPLLLVLRTAQFSAAHESQRPEPLVDS